MWFVDKRLAALMVDELYRAPDPDLVEANRLGSVARFLDGGHCLRGRLLRRTTDRTRRSGRDARLNRPANGPALRGLKPQPD